MGAGQSSNGSAGQRAAAAETKTSYYELLGVDRSATDDELKKAYRRKALELHPDRNYGDVERATRLFAEIQSAYEILSDAQERAWYDSHEDAILHGADPGGEGENGATYEHNVGMTSADDITRMFRQFNANIDFTDAPSGFYGFLRETFEQLAKEEQVAAARESMEVLDYPDFGHKDDDHDTVKAFYSVWVGFSTQKTFAWRDRYRTSDAEDRRMRRLMEKENQRFRKDAISEFNDAVRSLVAFVRKRDPRYKPNQQSEEERQKTLRDAAAAQAARMRAANQAKLDQEVPEWTKVREPDDNDEELFEEESEEEHFECVACRKTFKSENQWTAHEKSKKHVKAIQALRRKLKKEGVDLDLEDETGPPANGFTVVDDDDDAHSEAVAETGLGNEVDELTSKTAHVSVSSDADEEVNVPVQETSAADAHTESSASDSVDDDYASRPTSPSAEDHEVDPDEEFNDSKGKPPSKAKVKEPGLGRAAQKRAKRAAKEANAASDDTPHQCQGCSDGFPSKTRLFQHLQDNPQHAALKAAPGPSGRKGKKGKR